MLLKRKIFINCNAEKFHWVIYWEIKLMASIVLDDIICLWTRIIQRIPRLRQKIMWIRPLKILNSETSKTPSNFIFLLEINFAIKEKHSWNDFQFDLTI